MIQSDDDMYESAKESLARREPMALGVTCEEIIFLIDRLRQAEKDAARYRWIMNNAKLGIGRNGKDWDLQVDGPAPDSISEVGEWIDNRIDGRM